MKKKILSVVLLVTLAAFCLVVLGSCRTSTVNFFEYSEDDLGIVGKLVHLMHNWIGNYGWTVVVFTIFLKIVTSPLDIWQRISSRKSMLRMQKMQPVLAEIDKRYAGNPQRANEEKQKLYKKQGFSAFAMCLPMIISMVIFFVMFAGLRQYSNYSSVANFKSLSATYFDEYYRLVKEDGNDVLPLTNQGATTTFNDRIIALLGDEAEGFGENEHFLLENYTKTNVDAYTDAIFVLRSTLDKIDPSICEGYHNAALQQVAAYYEEHHESWLWLHNVWQPDTWSPIMQQYDGNNSFSSVVDIKDGYPDLDHYADIRNTVLQTGGYGSNGSWNGLMLLPIFSVVLSFLSIFLSQKLDRKVRKDDQPAPTAQNSQQAATNKMMMILMPLMMAVFGFMYTGAFAIYMVSNYLLSLVSTLALAYPVEHIVQRSLAKKEAREKSNKASYMR